MLSRGQAILFGVVGALVVGGYFAFQNSYSENRITILDIFQKDGDGNGDAGPGNGFPDTPGLPGLPGAPESGEKNATNHIELNQTYGGGGGPYVPPPVEEIHDDPLGFDCSDALVGYCDAWDHGLYNQNLLPFGNKTFLEANPECEDHPFFAEFGQPTPADCENLYLNKTSNQTS